jgi:hypothetical protein
MPVGGKSRPIKPVVKTGRSGMKPSISPKSKLGVSSGSEEQGGCGKESEDEADAEYLYCASLFTADHNGEDCFRCSHCLKWIHTVCTEYRKRTLCMIGVRNDKQFFIIQTNKCTTYIYI